MRARRMCAIWLVLTPHTTSTMDKRGRMAIKLSAKSPQRFADRLSRELDGSAPFVRRAVGPDARMVMVMTRLLPSKVLHHAFRVLLGIPRFGAIQDVTITERRANTDRGGATNDQ